MSKRTVAAVAGVAGAMLAAGVLATDEWNIGDPTSDFRRHGFVRRDLQTPPGRMTIYEAGEGEPLVFLHGIGGGASSWTWIFVAPAFAETHRVVVPDWVGWGSSEHPTRYVLFDDYVASLETLLEDLGQPATIVAQSLTCGFVCALARRRPELFKRLIMHTPSGGKDLGSDAFGPLARATLTPFAVIPGVNMAFYRALFHRSQFIGGWFRQEGFYDPDAVTREIVAGFLYSARKPHAAYSVIPFATGALRYDLAPYLRDLTVPASMFWGEQETQVGAATRAGLARLRDDIPLTLIENTKACPELERAARVIEIVREAIGTHHG